MSLADFYERLQRPSLFDPEALENQRDEQCGLCGTGPTRHPEEITEN